MGEANTKLKDSAVKQLALSTQGTFTEQEIQDWFKGFVKNCPSGHLTIEELVKVYSDFFPDGEAKEFAEYVYRGFEKNEFGAIGFSEFLKALAVLGRGSREEKLEWAFFIFDLEGTGEIGRKNMLKVVSAMYKMVGPYVNWNEDVNTPQKRVDKLFKATGKGRKDNLTFDDFCEVVKQDPGIWNLLRCDMSDSDIHPAPESPPNSEQEESIVQ